MKNLRKLLAVLIAATMIISAMIPAAAAGNFTSAAEAQKLYDMGLYKGTSATEFQPDLGTALTRESGVVMLVRMLGKEAAALALSDADVNATLIVFSDTKDVSTWAKKYVAYAVLNKLVTGNPNGTFAPKSALLGKDYCTLILRAMGYTVDANVYEGAAYSLKDAGGLTMAQAVKFNDKELIKDDMVGISYASLQAAYAPKSANAGKTLVGALVASKVVTEEKAIAAGVYGADLKAKAEAAVAAYEKAPYATKTDIDATAALLTAAQAASAKLAAADKKVFDDRIAAQTAKVTAQKNILDKATADEQAKIAAEKAKVDAAEAAVKAFENAAIVTGADVTAAEALAAPASDKAYLVSDAATRAGMLSRIDAKKAKIATQKVELANQTAATDSVNAYLAAKYTTLEEITAAAALEATATAKVALVTTAAVKTDLEKKVADRKLAIAAKKTELSPAEVDAKLIGLSKLEVNFSKDIDEDYLTNSYIKVCKLDSDGDETTELSLAGSNFINYVDEDAPNYKKVVLNLSGNGLNQGDKIKLKIDGLKDQKEIKLFDYAKVITLKDVSEPVINSVSVVNPKAIKIFTSEPLQFDTNGGFDVLNSSSQGKIKIDGTDAYAKVTSKIDKDYTLIEFDEPLAAGSHTMDVLSVKDYAGFSVSGTYTLNVATDTKAPVATSFKVKGTKEVEITFDENVASDKAAYAKLSDMRFRITQEGEDDDVQTRQVYATDTANVTFEDNKVTVKFGTALNIYATFGVKVNYKGVEDAMENAVTTEQTITGKAVDDSTKPTVVSVAVEDDNEFKVTFSEEVNVAKSNFNLVKGNGYVIDWTGADTVTEYYNNPDHKTFKVVFNKLKTEAAANWMLETVGVTDKSIRENEILDTQTKVALKDMKIPTVAYARETTTAGSTNVKVEVIFTENMDQSYTKDEDNYYIYNQTTGKLVTLSSMDDVSISVNSYGYYEVVTLSFKRPTSATIFNGIQVVAKDLAGNPLEASSLGSFGFTLAFTTTTNSDAGSRVFNSSVIDYIRATAENKITIKIKDDKAGNRFISSDFDEQAFELRNVTGNTVVSGIQVVGAKVASDGKSVELTLNTDLPDGLTSAGANIYYLATKSAPGVNDPAVRDQFGQVFALNTAALGNLQGGSAASLTDKIKPEQQSVEKEDKHISIGQVKKDLDNDPATPTTWIGYYFDPVTKLAVENISSETDNSSYIDVRFSEVVKGAGTSLELAAAFEVNVAGKILSAGRDFTASVLSTDKTKVRITFIKKQDKDATDIMKGKLKEDLSNLTVRIIRSDLITDESGNEVIVK